MVTVRNLKRIYKHTISMLYYHQTKKNTAVRVRYMTDIDGVLKFRRGTRPETSFFAELQLMHMPTFENCKVPEKVHFMQSTNWNALPVDIIRYCKFLLISVAAAAAADRSCNWVIDGKLTLVWAAHLNNIGRRFIVLQQSMQSICNVREHFSRWRHTSVYSAEHSLC